MLIKNSERNVQFAISKSNAISRIRMNFEIFVISLVLRTRIRFRRLSSIPTYSACENCPHNRICRTLKRNGMSRRDHGVMIMTAQDDDENNDYYYCDLPHCVD